MSSPPNFWATLRELITLNDQNVVQNCIKLFWRHLENRHVGMLTVYFVNEALLQRINWVTLQQVAKWRSLTMRARPVAFYGVTSSTVVAD